MGAEVDAVEQFGPYLVYERLGVGGMATVHRALERGIEGFERMVALKRLLPHLAEDASFIKSFVREAKLASLLNHVNIVQIFELGRVGAEYFISMEYIDGKDIRRILRHARKVTGPPPVNVVVGLLLQLCEALDYAHTKADENGQPLLLVHRDVSPSNVLVTTAGHVKVIDFGIAKAQSSAHRTQTGRVKGKLAYMAPEALSGKELDARSDLFALGVIAHELLTARPLFASKNEYQTLLKVQRGDIMPPSTFNQTCPPELDAIVLKALARDPDERFAAATEVRDELLAMRKRYGLHTGYRDIASWVEMAFSLEAPGGPATSMEMTGSSAIHKTPTPQPRREDDEAVEIAWGGGAEISDVGPVLLDDVPDVSTKHLSSALQIADEIDDDLPTPVPTHGLPASQPGAPHQRRGTAPGHTPALQTGGRRTARMMTQTTDPDGESLVDALGVEADLSSDTILSTTIPGGESEVDVPSDTILSMATAADTKPSLPVTPRISVPSVPIVRFHRTMPPPMGPPIKAIQTRPGHAPARALTQSPTDDDDAASTLTRDSRPKLEAPKAAAVGAGTIRKQRRGPHKTWLLVAGLFAAGAVATAVTLFVTRGEDRVVTTPESPAATPRPARAKTVGMVKFNLEPPDAEVWIEGKLVHSGSPWATELEPGAYQIQIQRTGYSAWLTSLELSAAETQVLRVVLEPLAGETNLAAATLKVTSSPPGLEAVIDGIVLPQKTPLHMPLEVGPHSIVLRQHGVDVWKQDLVAQAAVDYEFAPSMDADKQRERDLRRREQQPAAKPKVVAPVPAPTALPAPGTPSIAAAPNTAAAATVLPPPISAPAAPTPTAGTVTTPTPPPAPPPTAITAAKPAPAPTRPAPSTPPAQPAITTTAPKPVPPTAPARTITVPPSAVTKVSGSPPAISQHKHADVPASVASKVCISHTGRVTSVDVITKLDSRVASDITRAIEAWKYAPYTINGTPASVCFVVSFKLK